MKVGSWARVAMEGNNLQWSVGENNHAVESAHNHPMARQLFAALAKVKWTKGTGGEFRGNDEYNQESGEYHTGSGGSYATMKFGPLGDPYYATEQQREAMIASAQNWRARDPKNAGLCGQRTLVHGRQTGPPCKNSRHGCPVHNPRAASRLTGAYRY